MKLLGNLAKALLLLFVLGIGGCFIRQAYQTRQFARLEQNAHKVITAQELQKWALKLIADSHSYTSALQFHTIRTNYRNFPGGLGTLVPGLPPDLGINEANSLNSPDNWTNIPTTVSLIWGSGFMGHKGFIIGPTNFYMEDANAWAPGVYFYKH